MKNHRRVLATFSLFVLVCSIGLIACGRRDQTSRTNEGLDTDANVASAVVQTIGSAALEGESGLHSTTTTTTLVGSAIPNQCKVDAARRGCQNDTLKAQYAKCTTSSGNSSLEGEWSARYSPASACEMHQKNNELYDHSQILKTTSLFMVHGIDSNLKISTEVGTAGSAIGGLIIRRETDSESVTLVNIVGLRKTVVGKNEDLRSDLILHTNGGNVRVRGAKLARSRVASGIVSVDNKVRNTSIVVSLENVTWGSPLCCYPTAGSARIDTTLVDGTINTSRLNFDQPTCGMASTLEGKKTKVVALTLCEE